ncbi:NAD(P)H-dependent oxidoreductase [Alteromonas sp. CYL-A6]|uniref:NAD(P)H-dependent oxidoreductase n=1 Tax=Alteromonas nitratireducens TaxID=3390813 RepID=UPI0034B6C743
MNILDALNWRYAVRQFNNDTLSNEQINELTEATRLTASSYGLQPYRLLVISSKEIREKLLPHSMGQNKVRDCSHLFVLAVKTNIDAEYIDKHFTMAEQQQKLEPGALAGFSSHVKEVMCSMTFEQLANWAENQAHIAIGNLLTAAALAGVDACPMAGFDHAGFDEVLNLTEQQLSATVICALGRRCISDKSAEKPKVRIPAAEFVIEI